MIDAAEVGLRPIRHIGYYVEDIEPAVERWVSVLGAGPFFDLGWVEFEYVTHHGEPGVFDHRAAFGQWGSIGVELQQIRRAEPEGLRQGLHGLGADRINHVSVFMDDPERESARLEALGFPMFMQAGFDEICVRWHDAYQQLGFTIEVHQACPTLDRLVTTCENAARGWDGSDPFRSLDL
jgi:catechol 2,3-dioxygenase-like lactoylglutathione lyase family enzyme